MKKNVYKSIALSLSVIALLAGCSAKDVMPVKLEKQKITQKKNIYSEALVNLGRYTSIYNVDKLNVQTKGIVDDTGVSQRMASRGEIPYDITEMFKSAVNEIAGSVLMIDYDPTMQSNMMALGYTNFDKKIKPDVILSGGITEFDKSLAVSKEGVDGAAESGNFGLTGSYSQAQAADRVTIDVNLIDFDTFAMIPSMSGVNSVKMYSGRNTADVGISFLSNSFGVNGEVKKIQGKHAAVRTLVKYTLVEILGRYMDIPYWTLLPDGQEDRIVIESIRKKFFMSNTDEQTMMIQKLLYLHGYDLKIDGLAGQQTLVQLRLYLKEPRAELSVINFELFKELYVSVPVENNYRQASIFPQPIVAAPVAIQNMAPTQMATPEEYSSQEVANSPQDLTSFQEIFSDKKIIGKGIFKHKNETIALQIATNLAINDAAKKIGSVLQKEKTTLSNDQVSILITTQANNIVKGYEKTSAVYNEKTGRAVVEVELEGSVVAGQLEGLLNQ